MANKTVARLKLKIKSRAGRITAHCTMKVCNQEPSAASAALSCPEDKRIYMQIDGETVGNLPAAIVTVPDALTLLIPRSYHGISVVK